MHADRLLKLAAFLRELPDEKFDFGVVWCDTVGCAIGWCPSVFPDLVRLAHDDYPLLIEQPNLGHYADIGRELFGISDRESHVLFTANIPRPWSNGGSLREEATPVEVAKSIEAFVRWKEEGNAL